MQKTNSTENIENHSFIQVFSQEEQECEICSLMILDATLIPVIFSLIFVLGSVGNSIIIYTVLRNKSMKNAPNILIVSMAVGDLILILISVPFTAAVYAFPHWLFGNFVCKLNAFLQTVSLGVSIFTLTALSLEKYRAVIKPFKYHGGHMWHRTMLITALVWTFAVALAIPDAVSYQIIEIPDDHNNIVSHYCYPYSTSWPFWYSRFHVTFRAFIYYIVPFCIITSSYINMARHLYKTKHPSTALAINTKGVNRNYQKQVKSRRKIAKIVLVLGALFAICWLPRHVYLLWFQYARGSRFSTFWYVFKQTGFILSFINSCVNPYSLCVMSKDFRRCFIKYIFCNQVNQLQRDLPYSDAKVHNTLVRTTTSKRSGNSSDLPIL